MNKKLRPGKVFIDWSQNSRHKTTVAAYSLRARPRPDGVDTGRAGDEVERLRRRAGDLSFEAGEVLGTGSASVGDLFAPAATLRQQLPG